MHRFLPMLCVMLLLAAPAFSSCLPDDTTLCLLANRYSVQVRWSDLQGNTGQGHVVIGVSSDSSGVFWFFSPDNWELLIKMLDGCGVNGHDWVFGGAATNLGYAITVTDTQTGTINSYLNPPGTAAQALTDTSAFPCVASPPAIADFSGNWGGGYGSVEQSSYMTQGTIIGVQLTLHQLGTFVYGTFESLDSGGFHTGGLVGYLNDGQSLTWAVSMDPVCPGAYQGVVTLSDSYMDGSYHGQDCAGSVQVDIANLRRQ